jgi:hypothetical protein
MTCSERRGIGLREQKNVNQSDANQPHNKRGDVFINFGSRKMKFWEL